MGSLPWLLLARPNVQKALSHSHSHHKGSRVFINVILCHMGPLSWLLLARPNVQKAFSHSHHRKSRVFIVRIRVYLLVDPRRDLVRTHIRGHLYMQGGLL